MIFEVLSTSGHSMIVWFIQWWLHRFPRHPVQLSENEFSLVNATATHSCSSPFCIMSAGELGMWQGCEDCGLWAMAEEGGGLVHFPSGIWSRCSKKSTKRNFFFSSQWLYKKCKWSDVNPPRGISHRAGTVLKHLQLTHLYFEMESFGCGGSSECGSWRCISSLALFLLWSVLQPSITYSS